MRDPSIKYFKLNKKHILTILTMYTRLSYTIISTPEGTVATDYHQISYLEPPVESPGSQNHRMVGVGRDLCGLSPVAPHLS